MKRAVPKTIGPRAKILECRAQNECRVNAPKEKDKEGRSGGFVLCFSNRVLSKMKRQFKRHFNDSTEN